MSTQNTKRTEIKKDAKPKMNPYTIDASKISRSTNTMMAEKDGIRDIGGA